MKVRKFKIRICPPGETTRSWLMEIARRAELGLAVEEYDMVLSLPDLSSLAKIISPERLKIIQMIRNQKPESIYELAKLLERQLPNVQRDVYDLAKHGILELKKIKNKDSKRLKVKPCFNWSGFDIAV